MPAVVTSLRARSPSSVRATAGIRESATSWPITTRALGGGSLRYRDLPPGRPHLPRYPVPGPALSAARRTSGHRPHGPLLLAHRRRALFRLGPRRRAAVGSRHAARLSAPVLAKHVAQVRRRFLDA